MKKFAFNKIITILCLLLALTMLVCSCEAEDNGDNKPASSTTEALKNNETPSNSTTAKNNSETPADPSTITYKVTVIDETGAPVEGATVQLCVGNICKFPSFTNSNGVVTFDYEKDDYKALVTMDGYNCGDYVYFEAGSTELTITITKIAS